MGGARTIFWPHLLFLILFSKIDYRIGKKYFNMNYKKKVVLIFIPLFIVLIIIGTIFFVKQTRKEKEIMKDKEIISEESWKSYTDEINNFKVDYPSDLLIYKIDENINSSFLNKHGILEPVGGVSFVKHEDGPIIMKIGVYKNTNFQTVQDWLDYKTELRFTTLKEHNPEKYTSINNFIPPFEIEKKINISGEEAIVTYPVSRTEKEIYESFKNEKTTSFMKNEILYIIYIRYFEDQSYYEKIWNSFKFID
jgi:hypothetical protein